MLTFLILLYIAITLLMGIHIARDKSFWRLNSRLPMSVKVATTILFVVLWPLSMAVGLWCDRRKPKPPEAPAPKHPPHRVLIIGKTSQDIWDFLRDEARCGQVPYLRLHQAPQVTCRTIDDFQMKLLGWHPDLVIVTELAGARIGTDPELLAAVNNPRWTTFFEKPPFPKLLVVGSDQHDARTFLADGQRRQAIPEDVWPSRQYVSVIYTDVEDARAAYRDGSYDLVIFTLGAVDRQAKARVGTIGTEPLTWRDLNPQAKFWFEVPPGGSS